MKRLLFALAFLAVLPLMAQAASEAELNDLGSPQLRERAPSAEFGGLATPCGCVCTSTFTTGTDGCLPAGCAVSATVNDGAQSYRIFRDGVASECDPAKPCPGVYSSGYNPWDKYIFQADEADRNNDCRCMEVISDVNSGAFPCTLYIHSTAYKGQYNGGAVWSCSGPEAAPLTGTWEYVGDVGSSVSQSYYFPMTDIDEYFSIVYQQNYSGRIGCNYNFELACQDVESMKCVLVPLLDAIEYKLDNFQCGEGGGSSEVHQKVTLCHVPPGYPENEHTISVGESAVPAHLDHGDYLGECTGTGLWAGPRSR